MDLILSAKRLYPKTEVIIEVENIDDLKIVLTTHADTERLFYDGMENRKYYD